MSKDNFSKQPQKKISDPSSLTLTAVALQDHWSRSLSLGTKFGPRKIGLGPAARAQQKKGVKPVIDTGRHKVKKKTHEEEEKGKEYVLDAQPPPLTLAQKFGLVNAPKPLLSEHEWSGVKAKSNQRDDSQEPCVICKEDFGLQEQVLLSCSHVFHRACLQAFERFTGRKTCPMCRHEQYQTRVIHEGARAHKHKSATRIQSWWRGYVVRCWYRQLRETTPPKDPMLRKKFYEEKLSAIVDRMIKSIDVNMAEFLREIDSSVQQSRAVFSQWDAIHREIPPDQWEIIQLKAVERGEVDCPICLTQLQLTNCSDDRDKNSPSPDNIVSAHINSQNKNPAQKPTVCGNSRRKEEDRKLLEKLSKLATHQPNSAVTDAVTHDDDDDDDTGNDSKTATKERQVAPNSRSKNSNSSVYSPCDEGAKAEAEAPTKRRVRSTVLLSCTHVFHTTCLQTLEEIAMVDMRNSCPVCRAHYQKKIIVF